jgi:hypothetical protein
VTVLDSNPELSGLYYGEDQVHSWLAISAEQLEFRYEDIIAYELPFSSNVWIDGVGVATINYPPAFLGRSFCVVRSGMCYCGTVSENDIYL